MSKNKTRAGNGIKNNLNCIVISIFTLAMLILNLSGGLGRADRSTLVRIAYSIILAVSLNLVVGLLGELSLGHAGFMYVGAFAGCFFVSLF